MTTGHVLVGAPLLAAVGFVIAATVSSGTTQETQQAAVQRYEAPVDVDTAALRGPRQPIFYRHDVHAGQYEIDCQYCHVNLEISPKPGLPSVASCMNCHQIVGSGNPEVQKLREAYAEGRTIEWVEVHKLSQFVHFPHQRHVNSTVMEDLECQTCHGETNRMVQIYQFASLKMGWCLDCHKEQQRRQLEAGVTNPPVSTDCSACHY